mgnify:CR=1 FL=1
MFAVEFDQCVERGTLNTDTGTRYAAVNISGSLVGALVVSAWGPYFSVGNSLPDELPDELPFFASGVQSTASLAFGLTGVALSAAAIVLTVPRWGARSR